MVEHGIVAIGPFLPDALSHPGERERPGHGCAALDGRLVWSFLARFFACGETALPPLPALSVRRAVALACAMIAGEVDTGPGYQGDQLGNEVQWFEQDMGSAGWRGVRFARDGMAEQVMHRIVIGAVHGVGCEKGVVDIAHQLLIMAGLTANSQEAVLPILGANQNRRCRDSRRRNGKHDSPVHR